MLNLGDGLLRLRLVAGGQHHLKIGVRRQLPRDGPAAPIVRRLREAGYRLVAVPGPEEAAMELWRIEREARDE